MMRAGALGFICLMAAAPLLFGDYQIYLLTLTIIWAIMALSMGLVLGFVGQINLGQAAFVAIGAYVCTILRLRYGVNFWLAAPVALAAVVAVAAPLGMLTLRLKGPFFLLVMLAFAEITRLVIANWQNVTNGPLGLRAIQPPEPVLGVSFDTKASFYYLSLTVLTACLAALWRLIRSRTGRLLIAVREDELLAEFIGIPVMRSKVIGLCIGAFVAGLGGLLLGPFLTILAPSQFTLFASVDLIVMVVVGGIGTLAGPVIGALFLVYIPELLSFANAYRPALMGALLIFVVLFAPRGVVGALGAVRDRLAGPQPNRPASAGMDDDRAR
jgi:branched-chain amino acid transport system permease protein